MDRLIIKNFGPIKDISIDVNDINIFIGPTSSGKSTVAKLIAIFTDKLFVGYPSYDNFISSLREYNIDFTISAKTEIAYSVNEYSWRIDHNGLSGNHGIINPTGMHDVITYDRLNEINPDPLGDGWYIRLTNDIIAGNKELENQIKSKEDLQKIHYEYIKGVYSKTKQYGTLLTPIYIAAERILLSMVGESVFGLMKNDVSIAQCLKDFGALFETSRKNIKSFDVAFLNTLYEYTDKNNYLIFSDGARIKLEVASSGFQSLVPLMLVMEHYSNSKRIIDNCFVIEEPESNLYPTMQKALMEFIIDKVNKSDDKLIITTHSPYTLTTIDNLIQAKNAYDKHPELRSEIGKVVPEDLWIDYNKVSCYYFEDGYCKSTMDNEMQSIGPSNIDNVSEALGETFDRLLELKYRD